MKITTPEISWHGRDPIYSVDFQFIKDDIQRLATCGTDKDVRIWEVKVNSNGNVEIEFLASLSRHTRTVNVVRFSPCGTMLATAGDDSAILIWRLNEATTAPNIFGEEGGEEQRESWSLVRSLRAHLEDVYDICWGADGHTLMSGSVDNSAIYWDVRKGQRIALFPEHKSFVQGVAVDPRGLYLASLSADRHLRIFNIESRSCLHTISKVSLPTNPDDESSLETFKMFHDDTMKSFFRRLTFSPDGQLLIVPAGCIEKPDQTTTNVSYVFVRTDLTKPVLQLPGPKTATLCVRFCPTLFKLRPVLREKPSPQKSESTPGEDGDKAEQSLEEWEKYRTIFCLPYRMVYAVASEDTIVLYDTQQILPIAHITNVHYHTLSDLSWSPDGRLLVISSTDGFVTFAHFAAGELGEEYEGGQAVTVASRYDITRQEEERRAEKARRKKKAKEEDSKRSSTPAGGADAKEDAEDDKNAKAKVEDVENTPVEETEQMDTTPSTPSQSKARRVQITTLSSPNVAKTTDNETDVPDKVRSPKTPRRVGVKTITTFAGALGSTSPKQTTPKSSKKRVQLQTLATFDDKSGDGDS